MERESSGPAPVTDAGEQLAQLHRDQRWAKLTGDMPRGGDAIFGGGLGVHLLFVGLLVGISSGQLSNFLNLDMDALFVMATVSLFLPLYGQAVFQRTASGSWHGTSRTRPTRLEFVSVAATYLIGLCLVIWTATHGAWVLLAVSATLAGIGWTLSCRRWMVRYGAEIGYRGSLREYARSPLFVLCVAATNLLVVYTISLLDRLVSGP